MKTRHQKGYIYKKGGWWLVRSYDNVMQQEGAILGCKSLVGSHPFGANTAPSGRWCPRPMSCSRSTWALIPRRAR